MNTCGNCAHHRLDGPLAKHGYGHCAVRPNPAMRAGLATSAQATCRIGLFEAKKQDEATTGKNDPQNRDQAKDYATP